MAEPKSNGFSIASMACGIASIVLSGSVGIALAIVSLVMRAIYRNKHNGMDNSETQAGYITSIIGLVICGIQLLMVIALIVLFFALGMAGIMSAIMSGV